MNVPRTTLWTRPFRIPLRWAVVPFGDPKVDNQAAQICSNNLVIEITPGAMYIVSTMSGRRMPESIRWVLGDSLSEILHGDLRTSHPEPQDLLAGTLGEMLGILLLAFQLTGRVEIVRLIEHGRDKMPDYILIVEAPEGSYTAHLLECKGTVEDVMNVNSRGKLNACRPARTKRTEGLAQLGSFKVDLATHGQRATVQIRFGGGRMVSTQNLSVVFVPDGRIPSRISCQKHDPYKCCRGRPNCVTCISPSLTSEDCNVIGVLYRDEIPSSVSLHAEVAGFLRRYRDTEHAIWSESELGFTEAFASLVRHLSQELAPDAMQSITEMPALPLLALSLLRSGIDHGLSLRDTTSVQVLETQVLRHIEGMRTRVPEGQLRSAVHDAFQVAYQQERRELQMINGDELSSWVSTGAVAGRGHVQWRPWSGDRTRVYGSVRLDETTGMVRLAAGEADEQTFDLLTKYVTGLIEELRGSAGSVRWEPEYAELQGRKRIDLGLSWDKYPYPHQGRNLPGITAWVSQDCRAEIVVRRPSQ